MNATDLQARLQRLDGYLGQDPGNPTLLRDAFETARRLQDWPRAAAYVAQALRVHPEALWRLRAGEIALARLQWDDATAWFTAVDEDVAAPADLRSAARHQLAEVMLHTGRPEEGLALLAEGLADDLDGADLAPAAQVLWLRLLHRAGRLQEALGRAQGWSGAGHLSAPAAGVASLVALDLDRLDLAAPWAAAGLQSGHRQFEALIAQASMALGNTDAESAHALLEEALQRHPRDGRSWSMLAFAALLEQRFDRAIECFDISLQHQPDHVGTWHGLGWALIQRGYVVRARQVFERALAMDRNFAESHGGLAVALALAGERAAAVRAAETALRLDRASLAARYAEAVLAGRHRDLDPLRALAARWLTGRGTLSDRAAQRLAQQPTDPAA